MDVSKLLTLLLLLTLILIMPIKTKLISPNSIESNFDPYKTCHCTKGTLAFGLTKNCEIAVWDPPQDNKIKDKHENEKFLYLLHENKFKLKISKSIMDLQSIIAEQAKEIENIKTSIEMTLYILYIGIGLLATTIVINLLNLQKQMNKGNKYKKNNRIYNQQSISAKPESNILEACCDSDEMIPKQSNSDGTINNDKEYEIIHTQDQAI